jgi:regulator of sigma E protease
MMYRDPWLQLKWDAMSAVRVLQALIVPESKGERVAVARNVGGPIAIAIGLYHTVRGGMMGALGFLRMICVNLAILNLLPFPVLDGGHIVFALFEIITRRKPNPKVVSILVNAFAVLLIGLMALLFYSDIVKQIKFTQAVHATEREEAAAIQPVETAVTNAPAKP